MEQREPDLDWIRRVDVRVAFDPLRRRMNLVHAFVQDLQADEPSQASHVIQVVALQNDTVEAVEPVVHQKFVETVNGTGADAVEDVAESCYRESREK